MNSLHVVFVFLALCQCVFSQNSPKVIYLEAGDVVNYEPELTRRGYFQSDLRIYCHRGSAKTIGRAFETIQLQLDIEHDDFTQYEGETPEVVKTRYEEQKSIFSINLFSQKKTRSKINPFAQECIGIDTIQPYRVRLHLIRLDFWKVMQVLLGIFIFSFAAKLSENSVFYYITGVLIGICTSFMLLIYLAGKLFPKRPMMYGVLIGGWTIGIYIIQRLWENIQLILVTYQSYVFWYILITGAISFVFCYRLGPPKNKRSKDLIKWGLQLMALILIYFSSQFEEASAAFTIITFVTHYFPRSWLRRVRLAYLHRFPPKVRLLTNEEYYEQGVKETTKALEDLRNYCSSPECKQWRIMKKLKDPLRFAEFVEGESHIRDEEILKYESSRQDLSDSELSEEEEEAPVYRQAISRSGEDEVDLGYRSTSVRSPSISSPRNAVNGRWSYTHSTHTTNNYKSPPIATRTVRDDLSEED
ncbi:nuclear envelope integral membrane protein [Episyrphus balteatus]|uniref:nuclear envelope integral membrane protein n=1 Tax=Episyrphus balteatus TaxID=286459 RepID=UPI002485A6BF|nr:nuclear envelope integral membrane protein [Episyrphus balteatus]